MGKPIEGSLEKVLERNKNPNSSEPKVPQNTNLGFQSDQDFWTVDSVSYNGDLYKVDLSKKLLDDEKSHTQDEWAQFSKTAKQNGDFYVGDFPLYHSLFTALYDLRDSQRKNEIENVRGFLEKQFMNYWLMTLTRIKYSKKGKDTVVHNHGMSDQYEIREEFVGQDEWVENATIIEPYKALLGEDDLPKINSVYQWLTGKKPYLYRVNSKPDKDIETVARFLAGSYGADLGCGRGPSNSDPALGVRSACEKI